MTILLFAAAKGIVLSIAQVLFFIVTILMIFAILLQEGKGGGLAALGGTRAEGVVGATNPIRRLTVVLAILFFLLAGFITWNQKAEGLGDLTENQKPSTGSTGASSESGPSPLKATPPDGAPDITHPSPLSVPGEGEQTPAAKPENGALTPSDSPKKDAQKKDAEKTKETADERK